MYIPWEELESSMTTKSLLAAELVSVASSRLKEDRKSTRLNSSH